MKSYVLKVGCAWADLPRKYGSPTTCWRRLKHWQELGIWDRIWRKCLQLLDEQNQLDLSHVYLDGSFVSAKRGGDEVGRTKIGNPVRIPKESEKEKRSPTRTGRRVQATLESRTLLFIDG